MLHIICIIYIFFVQNKNTSSSIYFFDANENVLYGDVDGAFTTAHWWRTYGISWPDIDKMWLPIWLFLRLNVKTRHRNVKTCHQSVKIRRQNVETRRHTVLAIFQKWPEMTKVRTKMSKLATKKANLAR